MINSQSRFYSDIYDSIFQRSYYKFKDDSISKWIYLGKLRLDALLSERVILLDTQLLDGAFFLDTQISPIDIFDKLKRGDTIIHPLEIRVRDLDLKNTILGFVKVEDKGLIKNFSFSCITDPEKRKLAAQLLQTTSYEKITDIQDILQKFKDAEVSQENIKEIESSWMNWIELPEKGLRIVKQAREKGFPIDEFVGSKDVFLRGIVDQEVIKEGEWILANLNKRSDIDQRVEEKRKIWNQPKMTELIKLAGRYIVAYDKTIAWQSDCPFFESTFNTVVDWFDSDQINLTDIEKDISLERFIEIQNLDKYFLYKLGTMPNGEYERIFWENTEDITRWWYYKDYNSLQRYIEKVVDQIISIKEAPQKRDDNTINDFVKLFKSVVDYFGNIGTISENLKNITIKHFSNPSPREILTQRIIDLAKKRENN